ncbi:MAG: hypothetical protein DRP37_02220 [Thermodesulfobacteriota bacterium]|nr:MAG: hypothetical protein DRP37_02220 [Thermodesulfobacteriota bacterium]
MIWDEVAFQIIHFTSLAFWLLSSQEFFRAFEEKGPKTKKGVSHLKLVLKVGNRVGNTLLTKEKRLRKIS